MPENFTGFGDFEDYLQQFNTAAFVSGRYSTTYANSPHYDALRLRQNALHYFTTISAAQQTDFTFLVNAFRRNCTTNVDILQARYKTARQQTNHDITSFLCDVRRLARRTYHSSPHLMEHIVLTTFIESLSDYTFRSELRKSKPATSDDALIMAMETNFFPEFEKGARLRSMVSPESVVNLVSRTSSELQKKNNLMDQFDQNLTEKLN